MNGLKKIALLDFLMSLFFVELQNLFVCMFVLYIFDEIKMTRYFDWLKEDAGMEKYGEIKNFLNSTKDVL